MTNQPTEPNEHPLFNSEPAIVPDKPSPLQSTVLALAIVVIVAFTICFVAYRVTM